MRREVQKTKMTNKKLQKFITDRVGGGERRIMGTMVVT